MWSADCGDARRYDWLLVELLFVPDSLRARGLGSELMKRAETEALARGCHSAWLDTFEFQAREFYERIGSRASPNCLTTQQAARGIS